MVVAKRNGLRGVAVGVEADEGSWLRGRQQVAPMVKHGCREVYAGNQCPVCCDQVAAYRTCGQGAYREWAAFDFGSHLQHVVAFGHHVAGHGREQTHDVRLVGTDDKVERLLWRVCVGSHVFLVLLPLVGDGDDDVAVSLFYAGGRVSFPQGFVALQRRVEIHEIE